MGAVLKYKVQVLLILESGDQLDDERMYQILQEFLFSEDVALLV
jgi:hypothetical protein